jgi:hypothetical protein
MKKARRPLRRKREAVLYQPYNVGLTTAPQLRLGTHGKNLHGNSRNRFSVYLTVKDRHLTEAKALPVRIGARLLRGAVC